MSAVPDSRELMRAIAATQDRGAFSALFSEFAPKVKRFLLRHTRGNETLADELTQEVMVRVWRKAGYYNPDRAAVSTWIYTIARNVRIDHARRKRPEVDDSDPALVVDPKPKADDIVDENRRAASVRSALAKLPPDQAAIIQGAYFEGQSLREVAESLDIPVGTAKSRVRLAMSRLRRALGRENL